MIDINKKWIWKKRTCEAKKTNVVWLDEGVESKTDGDGHAHITS